jgi:predicted RNA-binding Zn-ribbon protein involved in translation (DUF1610 family)
MNKYRISGEWDETLACVCLACKNEFHVGYGTTLKFCPECGVKYDGIFDIKNPRYHTKNTYDWRNPGYKADANTFIQSDKPRLIIEHGQIREKELSAKTFFAPRKCKKELVWRYISHTTLDWIDSEEGSAAAQMIKSYHRCLKQISSALCDNGKNKLSYPNLRLVLLKGTERRILKERILEIPSDEVYDYVPPTIQLSGVVRCSG